MPGLKEKSLVVIPRFVDNGGFLKIYTMAKSIRYRRAIFELFSQTRTAHLCSLILVTMDRALGSVHLPIVHNIIGTIKVADGSQNGKQGYHLKLHFTFHYC